MGRENRLRTFRIFRMPHRRLSGGEEKAINHVYCNGRRGWCWGVEISGVCRAVKSGIRGRGRTSQDLSHP